MYRSRVCSHSKSHLISEGRAVKMFKLSSSTNLQVLQSKFNSGKYLKLVRIGNQTKKDRWLNFAASTWEAIDAMAQQITRELESLYGSEESEQSFEINGKNILKITKFRGLLYVGFCQVNGEFTNRININADEWKKLLSNLHRVKKLVHAPAKKKRSRATTQSQMNNKKRKRTTPEPCSSDSITKYQWVILGTDGVEHKRSERWYFLEDICGEHGIDHIENDEEILIIDSRKESLPAPLEVLELVYAYLVQEIA